MEYDYHERLILREALTAHTQVLLDRINAGKQAEKQLAVLADLMQDVEEPEDK